MKHFRLTPDPIDRAACIAELEEAQAGALVAFEGWVRNHNQGKRVSALEYQVYETLALSEGERILAEAREKFNLHRVSCTHRYGLLPIGETAVWIGAVASHRDDAFRATRYVIDEIKLRLPIWKKEHYVDESPEWVFCRDHATHVHLTEAEYYGKQKSVVDPGRLRSARVIVVGAGGLGCPALVGLVSAGVGHVRIVDPDTVSASNLHRQFLYSVDAIGEKKITVARARLTALNPFVTIETDDLRVDATNVGALIAEGAVDVVLDCTDNLETKFRLHDACFRARVPLVSASIYRFEGQIRTFDPKNPSGCLRCTSPETPDDAAIGNCNDFGVLGAAVSTIGALQASEAIAFLTDGTNASLDETFYFDVKNLAARRFRNLRRANCAVCEGRGAEGSRSEGSRSEGSRSEGGRSEGSRNERSAPSHPVAAFVSAADLPTPALEIDASALAKLPNVELVDVRTADDDFLNQYRDRGDRTVVVYCHRGIHSKRLVAAQRALGYGHFYSLRGRCLFSLTLAFLGIALAYSTVGFGGGSSYIAMLAVAGVSYAFIPKISLLCNLLVVTGGCYHSYRQGYFSRSLLLPFVLSSVPMAYLGGYYPLREKTFFALLTFCLVLAGARILFVRDREAHEVHPPGTLVAVITGAILGGLSGAVGIGGGIFLSPLLINLGWARSKNAAAVASAFILLNSVAGLAGQFTKNPELPPLALLLPLFAAVLIGGQVGSRIGTDSRVSYAWIQRGTGILTLAIAGRLLWQTLF